MAADEPKNKAGFAESHDRAADMAASEPAQARQALASVARRDRARADAALAMAARERLKARGAEDRVRALEAEIAALRGSAAWRLTFPLRRLASTVPPSLYRAVRGEMAARPSVTASVGPDAPAFVGRAEQRPSALLIDDWFPQPDRDSGSIDIVNLAQILLELGFRVLFGADRDHATAAARRDALVSIGVHPLGPDQGASVGECIERHGATLTIVVLNRLYCGGNHYEAVRTHAPQARVVFNTVDLHWVRLEREASVCGDSGLLEAAERARTRELFLAREADATIVVSSTERDMLAQAAPEATVLALPLARPVRPPNAPFTARSGIGFIGGFSHAPNLDALRWFTAEIWPLVRARLPDCRFSVVGSDLPAGTLNGVAGNIEVLGHLPDVGPWFESLRVSVAPLRFGAGAKGKVVSSLAAGVPCVGTMLALEGMEIEPSMDVADRADEPASLARLLVAIHEDPLRWQRMSDAGVLHVRRHFSIATWRERIAELLWILDVLPAGSKPD